ncbi:hypothetical protein GE09DRAFT_1228990 [Coniochaeta sp. 2T2.1]|nr:hypothetical protein GE09DRAFT_1228990 [Coniochaeta sp. 2T2.1]
MTNISRLAVLMVTLLTSLHAVATPLEDADSDTKPGLTHEEFLEVINLNSTDGWEPLSRVPVYEVTEEGQILDFGQGLNLHKRGGDRTFDAHASTGDCNGKLRFSARNFGCGVCITASTHSSANTFGSGFLWRQEIKGKYPTAAWFAEDSCRGSVIHSQGILKNEYYSCDAADQYGIWNLPKSVMLYQGC